MINKSIMVLITISMLGLVLSFFGCAIVLTPWVEWNCPTVIELPEVNDTSCPGGKAKAQKITIGIDVVERDCPNPTDKLCDGRIAACSWAKDKVALMVQKAKPLSCDPTQCKLIQGNSRLTAFGPKMGSKPMNWPNPVDYSMSKIHMRRVHDSEDRIVSSSNMIITEDLYVDGGQVFGLDDAGAVDGVTVGAPTCDTADTTCTVIGGIPSDCITCISDKCCMPYDAAGGINSTADIIVQCYNSGDTSQCPLQPPYNDPKLASLVACINIACLGPKCPVTPLIYVTDAGFDR